MPKPYSLHKALWRWYLSNRPSGRRLRRTTRLRIFIRDLRCRYCGKWHLPGRPFEIDHIYPYSWGGRVYRKYLKSNLALSCRACNRRKGAQHWQPARLTIWGLIVDPLLILLIDQPRPEDFEG